MLRTRRTAHWLLGGALAATGLGAFAGATAASTGAAPTAPPPVQPAVHHGTAVAAPVAGPTAVTAAASQAAHDGGRAADLVVDASCGDALRLAGTELCTHGEDHPTEAARGGDGWTVAEANPPAPTTCDAGPMRVQAVYAYAGGAGNRAGELVPRIRSWAGTVDRVFRESSNGARSVRWVAGTDCVVEVAVVHLSSDAEGSFATTVRELRAAGFDRPDRRYLVWFDAAVYCGVATVQHDDRPDGSNRNNGSTAAYGRVDTSCWGGPTEAHELVHMLGGVQPTAPNATRLGHCRDASDLLCYPDEAGVQMRQVCGREHAMRLDCGGDDYFNVAPSAGSYLARHWNVANSGFLVGAPVPSTRLDYRFAGTLSLTQRTERHVFAAGAGVARMSLTFDPGASENHVGVLAAAVGTTVGGQPQVAVTRPAVWTVRVVDPAGRVVAEQEDIDGAIDLVVTLARVGDHTVEVLSDGSGSWSAVLDVSRP